MNELEKKKKQLELARVSLAKQELELKIEEKLDEIGRLESAIVIQDKKIEDLKKELE
jgi:HAMP domain-containing protein